MNAQRFYEKRGFRKNGEKRKISRGNEYSQVKYRY